VCIRVASRESFAPSLESVSRVEEGGRCSGAGTSISKGYRLQVLSGKSGGAILAVVRLVRL
jgi:hypothetical protein